MKISARNSFKGTVVAVKTGPVNSTVKVDIGGDNTVTSMITTEAAEELGLKEGAAVHVIVKASNVMLALD